MSNELVTGREADQLRERLCHLLGGNIAAMNSVQMAAPPRVRIAEEVTTVKGPVIEVRVGRVDSKSFTVHECLLRSSTRFFDRWMLNGNWREATERVIELPEDRPEIFAIYMTWLYQKQIATVRSFRPDGTTEFLHLVQAYIFGDKIQAKAFQNVIINAIIEKKRDSDREGLDWFQGIPDPDCVDIAYQNTHPHSPLRRLMVDMWALTPEASFDGLLPDEFFRDMVEILWPYAREELASTETIQPFHYYVR